MTREEAREKISEEDYKLAEEVIKPIYYNSVKKDYSFARYGVDCYRAGFNKANEWHYMKDGIMPEENQWVLVYDGSYTVCNYHSNAPIKWLDNYENEVYESTIIAWKEIVLPKEIEEND